MCDQHKFQRQSNLNLAHTPPPLVISFAIELEQRLVSALALIAGSCLGQYTLAICLLVDGMALPLPLLLLCLAVTTTAASAASSALLPRLSIDPASLTVSGISSGADFAVQLAVAFSDVIHGVGVFAGQPYLCALQRFDEPLTTCAAQPANARGAGCAGLQPMPCFDCPSGATVAYDHCKQPAAAPGRVDVDLLVARTKAAAFTGAIAPVSHLASSRVYLYRGTLDTVYLDGSVNKTAEFFRAFAPASSILFEASIPSQHAFPSADPWLPAATCGRNAPGAPPAMANCGYDGAGAVLQHVYQHTLTAPPSLNGSATDPALSTFNQTSYFSAGAGWEGTGLGSTGWVYVPPPCAAPGSLCKLHVALHGCGMSANNPAMNTSFVAHTGFNSWAAANRIVVLYPQSGGYREHGVTGSAPSAQIVGECFDGYGQIGLDAAFQGGPQMASVRAMIRAIAGF